MLQPSDSPKGYHASSWRRPWRDSPGIGRILLQAQMTTVLVIIGNEFVHKSVKLLFVEDDDFIQ